jgi:hypothetical protein
MTNVYLLAKTWRYLTIISAVLLFVFFWSIFLLSGGAVNMPLGAWILLLVVSVVSVGMIYGALTSKFITSPLGFEHLSFGIRMWATWDQVESIEFTPEGFINLHVKEPISINILGGAWRFLYSYDKTIQLSPYIADLATSDLLQDIANYIPHSNIPAVIAQPKSRTQTYQEAGVIGLYYLGWFIIWFLFSMGLQKRLEEFLATWGLSNAHSILTFVGLSLVIGLFVSATISLRRYNADIVKLDERGISRQARTYYLSPFVIILISSLISYSITAVLPILFESRIIYVLVLFLIARVALPVSSKIERILF